MPCRIASITPCMAVADQQARRFFADYGFEVACEDRSWSASSGSAIGPRPRGAQCGGRRPYPRRCRSAALLPTAAASTAPKWVPGLSISRSGFKTARRGGRRGRSRTRAGAARCRRASAGRPALPAAWSRAPPWPSGGIGGRRCRVCRRPWAGRSRGRGAAGPGVGGEPEDRVQAVARVADRAAGGVAVDEWRDDSPLVVGEFLPGAFGRVAMAGVEAQHRRLPPDEARKHNMNRGAARGGFELRAYYSMTRTAPAMAKLAGMRPPLPEASGSLRPGFQTGRQRVSHTETQGEDKLFCAW